jgi:ribosomal protein S18 acetylase RimI-like enzyme
MTEPIRGLYKLQKHDIRKLGPILGDAFQHDPIWNRLFKDEHMSEQKLFSFFEAPVRYCMKFGEAYATSENLEGVAAWVPGDQGNMTMWRMLRSGALLSAMKIGAGLGKKMKQIMKSLPEDRKQNMGESPYIYLLIVGVASTHQGKGWGGKLIRAVIGKSEAEGKPIYLETETMDNVKLYEKYGFHVVKKITLPVVNLPMWEMRREASAQQH